MSNVLGSMETYSGHISLVLISYTKNYNYVSSINFNVFSMTVHIHNNQYSMDIDWNSCPHQERSCKKKFLLNVHHALIQFLIVTMQGSYGN